MYQVVPKSKVVKCHTHYSVVLCQEEMKRCIDRFKKLDIRLDWSDNEIESKYIHLMHEAYLGNSTAADTLDLYFGYDFDHFEEYEWICQSAVVVRRCMKCHDMIDSVTASSVMNPLFDMLDNVRDMERDYKNSSLPFNWKKAVYDNIVDMFNF